MDRKGVIAPDPSPQRTKTPTLTRGMNSRNEWTVFRETMSFYGAAQNRLIPVEYNGENVRLRRCLDQLRADRGRPSDRGLVHPPVNHYTECNRTEKRSSNPEADSVLHHLASTR